MKLVSIIVPIYDAEPYLEECIDSIKSQSYDNLEIVLVDDGSKDSSLTICEKHAKQDSRITVIHQENQGVSSARNVGMAISHGDFIYFMDADDVLANSAIKEMVGAYDKYNTAGMVAIRYSTDISQISVNSQPRQYSLLSKDILIPKIAFGSQIAGYTWNKLLRRDVIQKMKFDETVYVNEDQLFVLQYALRINECIYIDCPLYYYRITPNSATSQAWNNRKATAFSCYIKIATILKENNYLEYKEYAGKHAVYLAANYYNIISNFKQKGFWKKKLIIEYRCLKNMGDLFYCDWKDIVKSLPFLIMEKFRYQKFYT